MKQLPVLLAKSDEREVFEGLMSVFNDTSRPFACFQDQSYAGRALQILKPACTVTAATAIQRALSNWDASIEELPFYFADEFGLDTVLAALDEIEGSTKSDRERHSVETFRYWLKAYTYRGNSAE
jgi:hypothetical protein